MPANFLNVDLEIKSVAKLDLLIAEMGERVFVLYSGPLPSPRRQFLALESARQHKTPDAAILALCSVVGRLSPAAKHLWDAVHKVFDIGYELRPAERASQFSLRPATLEKIVALGAALAVTYYQPSKIPLVKKKSPTKP